MFILPRSHLIVKKKEKELMFIIMIICEFAIVVTNNIDFLWKLKEIVEMELKHNKDVKRN